MGEVKKQKRFKNLEAEFTRIGFSVEKVAQELGFERALLYNRLNLRTNFTLNDMLKIQKLINDKTNAHYTLDYLFARG